MPSQEDAYTLPVNSTNTSVAGSAPAHHPAAQKQGPISGKVLSIEAETVPSRPADTVLPSIKQAGGVSRTSNKSSAQEKLDVNNSFSSPSTAPKENISERNGSAGMLKSEGYANVGSTEAHTGTDDVFSSKKTTDIYSEPTPRSRRDAQGKQAGKTGSLLYIDEDEIEEIPALPEKNI